MRCEREVAAEVAPAMNAASSYSRRVPETIDVCALDELPPGAIRRVEWEDLEIMVVNCEGTLLAMEDRCSHDNGDLAEGELDPSRCAIECPRHGSWFDLRSGRPLNLPAYVPVEAFAVSVEDGRVRVAVE
jgi:3-phenylpropionate/trans-cinnamate dioxygenase ferredoxin subunit